MARHLLMAATLAWGGSLSAQEIQFTATVDRNSIAAGEHLRLTVTLVNSREPFTAPDLGGLVIVQGPFESSSFNYVNGRMSSSVSRTWTLTATAPGKYVIGPAKVKVGGGTIQTEPITIEAAKGAAHPPDPSAAQGQRSDPNLFATISLSRDKAHVGDQVIATYTLYSRYGTLEPVKYDLPKLNGFWAEEVDLGNVGWADQPATINGIQYRVAVLKRQVLFPQRSGKLSIEPARLTYIVNRSFFNRGTQVEVVTNAVEFTAMDLPPGPPAGFNGAVGELQLTVKTDRTRVKANEAIEITMRISGRSNLKLLDAPRTVFPDEFETYDPKVTDKITVNANGMSGSREFQYTLIPRHEGRYELDPITFSYFDTKTGKYRTLGGEPITIEVEPGVGGPSAQVQRPSKSDVRVLDQDIRYIRTGDLHLRPEGERLYGSWPWVAGMAAPALGFLLLLGWRRARERELADRPGMRRKRAERVAREQLRAARTALDRNDRDGFYTALGKALHGYIADKLSLGLAEVTEATVRERFANTEDGAELAGTWAALVSTCDMARFAPIEERPRQMVYDEAAALIGRIEQRFRA